MPDTVIVAGATGVVGQGALRAFAAKGDQVIALCRRAPAAVTGTVSHVQVDLQNSASVLQALPQLAHATHLVYAALFEKPGLLAGWVEADQMQTNLVMLENLLGPLLTAAPKLRHVSLLQGTKAYGAHLHAISIPARESSPRDPHENFYWLQEDYLTKALSRMGGRVTYTIVRPQIVFGHALKSAMNMIPVLGVYAALLKAQGEPLHFPGAKPAISMGNIQEAVDADLLGRMLCWAANAPEARNETFNVTNGDVFVLRNLWPAIAGALGMSVGDDQPRVLAQWLPEQASRWRVIQKALGLRSVDMPELLGESHFYADALLGVHATKPGSPALVSTIKLRQAGFHECIDTEHMFARLFADLQRDRVLPPASWTGIL